MMFGSTLVSRLVDILRLDNSVSERLRLYRAAAKLFYEYPLVGVGFRQFRFYTEFEITDVHNTYLQIGAELGLVGLILFLLMCAHLVRRSVLIADNEYFGTEWLGGFLFMTLVQGLFLNMENFRSFWLTAGFILAIFHCERRRSTSSPTIQED
jgi:O-antigen ligase